MNVQQLENELWEAADQLRANSKLTAAEYSMPVLGLIFLRHGDNRFKAYLPDIEADIPPQVPAAQREALARATASVPPTVVGHRSGPLWR